MEIKIKPASVIVAELGLEPNGRIHNFFTNECARQMDRYVPFDTGALAGTVITNGSTNPKNVTVNTIIYDQEYARKVYFKIGIKKYSLDKHPQAGPFWDKRMWSAKKEDILQAVRKEIKKGE